MDLSFAVYLAYSILSSHKGPGLPFQARLYLKFFRASLGWSLHRTNLQMIVHVAFAMKNIKVMMMWRHCHATQSIIITQFALKDGYKEGITAVRCVGNLLEIWIVDYMFYFKIKNRMNPQTMINPGVIKDSSINFQDFDREGLWIWVILLRWSLYVWLILNDVCLRSY